MTAKTRALPLVAVTILAMGPAAGEAVAQAQVGIGYVVNAPRMFLGFSAHAVADLWGGIGIYADAKFDRSGPRDDGAPLLDDLTVEIVEDELGDLLFVEEAVWRSYNVALVRPITPELMLYAGGGLAEHEDYRQYIDRTGERGQSGYYWINDPEASGSELNVLGGGMFRISSAIMIQFGVESAPRGATVGVIYSLPLR